MPCELTHEVLLLDSAAVRAADARGLEAHAALCPDCEDVLRTLRRAREDAGAFEHTPTAAARARAFRALQRPAPALPLWAPLAACAAAAVIVFLAARTGHRPEGPALLAGKLEPISPTPDEAPTGRVPHDRWLRASGPTTVAAGPAKLTARAGTLLLVPRKDQSVLLGAGELAAAVDKLRDGHTFEVTTREARVQVIGTRFTVRASERGTDVAVEEGTVWVWTGAEQPTVLTRGQTTHVPSESTRDLEAARATLPSDAPRAAAIATAVLERRPAGDVEAAALALLADAQRRSGRARDAAATYLRVAEHPAGRAYAEEALFQRAALLGAEAADDDARAALARARALFPNGALRPERAALEAELELRRGDIEAAGRALDSIPPESGISAEVPALRARIAQAAKRR